VEKISMFLCLESSTTSAKALLFDPEKRSVVKVKSEAYPPEVAAWKGEVGLHDAEAVVRQTLALGRAVCEDLPEKGAEVEAVALGGTFHSVVVNDAAMKPVTPTYTWMYNGASELTARLRQDNEYTQNYYHRTGCMVHALYPAFQLMLLRDQGFRFKDKLVTSESGLVFHALTGERVESAATNSGGGLINTARRDWDDETLSEIGLSRANMSPALTYRDTRPLSKQGAAALGLPVGIPVLPAHPDGALNQVGAGALVPGVMTFSVGTSAALRLSVDKPLIPEKPSTWCYLSPEKWMSGAATNGACNCIDWGKASFFPDAEYRDIESRPVDFANMPYFLPFLYGERCPGWQDGRKGGFVGVLAKHTSLDLYMSILEGVLFNLYQCYGVLTGIAGVPKQIQLSGGVLNSARWKQMTADIFGREMNCSKIPHASLMGAAALALRVTGRLASLEDYTVEAQEVVAPDMAAHEMYEKRFAEWMGYYG
jgi:gluconokinase